MSEVYLCIYCSDGLNLHVRSLLGLPSHPLSLGLPLTVHQARPLDASQNSPLPSLATSRPSLSTLHLGDFASAVPPETHMAPSLTSLRSLSQCPSSERLPVHLPYLTHLAILFPDSASLYHDLTDIIPFYLVCVWLVSISTTKNVNSWRGRNIVSIHCYFPASGP